MRVVLDITAHSSIMNYVQVCETPEGFQRMKEEHPEDSFIVRNSMSQIMLDEFLKLLTFMGWKAEDWWISNAYSKENFMPVQDEKDEEEAAYWENYEEPEYPEYNWPNGNPYESEAYRHYGVFPNWW